MQQQIERAGKALFGLMLLCLFPLTSAPLLAADEQRILHLYPESSVTMRLERVSEHVYVAIGAAGMATDNEGFISNAAAVVTSDGIVIFDALGTPSLARKFIEQLRQVSDQPIKRVIISHYHADHIYGMQVFRELGADMWAPAGALEYLQAPVAEERLEERRFSLEPWVDERTELQDADNYLTEDASFTVGDVTFNISVLGTAHSEGDLAMYVSPDRVLLSGDIIFEGRVPYVGNANTRNWLKTLESLETQNLSALVPGHGPLADKPNEAVTLTRRYLAHLRGVMETAVEELVPFDEAFDEADWSEFAHLPAFEFAHRRNAYQVYLSLEAEQLAD